MIDTNVGINVGLNVSKVQLTNNYLPSPSISATGIRAYT
jgi:hypothetical protein